METLHFETTIDAPVETVWDTMLGEETYREWTAPFMEGSYYEGTWEVGSRMLFLGPERSGMVAEIADNKPYEFISIKHIGIVSKGVEDRDSKEAKNWSPAYENYTFTKSNGGTTVTVDMETNPEYKEEFEKAWPRALEKLKALCEK